jgi:hypothetical protein
VWITALLVGDNIKVILRGVERPLPYVCRPPEVFREAIGRAAKGERLQAAKHKQHSEEALPGKTRPFAAPGNFLRTLPNEMPPQASRPVALQTNPLYLSSNLILPTQTPPL